MILKPIGNYVLLEVNEYDEVKHGIVLPPNLRKKIPIGVIRDIGSLITDLRIGETVIFDKGGTKAIPNTDLVLVPDYRIYLTQEE